jgi:GR25 family glycosyltransferase involved in LPS biosynthesis
MYDLHVYFLHEPTVCSARADMCSKLVQQLTSPSAAAKMRCHVTHVTSHAPGDDSVAREPTDYSPDAIKSDCPDLASQLRPLNRAQVSCAMKHARALEMIAARMNQPGFHLVLEDDVVFSDGVAAQLDGALRALPTNYDVAYLGLPSPSTPQEQQQQTIVFKPAAETYPALPACDSYVVNPAAAARMLSAFRPLRLPANLTLTLAARRAGAGVINAYIAAPSVFLDGSKVGVYVSQQDPNNRLIWNVQYAALEAACSGPAPDTQAKLAEIQQLIDSLHFKVHPDVLKLIARLQMRLGNYKEAETIYQQVLNILRGEACVINSQSQFLREYMSMYRHMQSIPTSVK